MVAIPRALFWIVATSCLGQLPALSLADQPSANLRRVKATPAAVLQQREAEPDDAQQTESNPERVAPPLPAGEQRLRQPPFAPAANLADLLNNRDNAIRLVLGQGRILTTASPVVKEGGVAVIAVGDPTVADFEVLPNPRMLRLIGKRPGVTDLTLVTSDEKTLVYELRVEYDLKLIQAKLRQSFPAAAITVSQLGESLVLEGQARDPRQIVLIESAVQAMLDSVRAPTAVRIAAPAIAGQTPEAGDEVPNGALPMLDPTLRALQELTPRVPVATAFTPQIINLITMPGVQQVLLQVRIAELNRTGLREIGADSFFEWGPGNILGTKISSATLRDTIDGASDSVSRLRPGSNSTAFGIFPTGRVEFVLRALHQNSLLRILAEPNLVALSGHEASFLAGGEFPVPVPQGNAVGGGNVTVRFKQFGVQLNFVPHIQDDEVIRLEVRPEVSTIDESLGTTLVVGGDPVPGINTRRVQTTVELREGESLALAGLLQVTLDANTARIPLLGDLPVLGPFFSNTTHKRVEKELLVLVTPYLVSPMNAKDAPLLPGDEVEDPSDLEFYLLNRIERGHKEKVPHAAYQQDSLTLPRIAKSQKLYVTGPVGFAPPVEQRTPAETLPLPNSSRRKNGGPSP